MSDSVFVDTNVLVYLFDRDAPGKQRRVRELLAAEAPHLTLSTQVLAEFYVTVTRKLARPLPAGEAEAAVAEFCTLKVVSVEAALVRAGISRARRDRMSLWDALIIEAALAGQCERLLSEDFQDGRVFDGYLTVANPFRG